MPDIVRNTPLSALQGVALDTETTGLDTKTARIVEIGAVAFGGEPRRFQSFVRPGTPVPAASTAIHGIDDAMLREAPGFAEAWPRAEAFLGDSVLLGHSLGFDLAILERECARAGLPWRKMLWLDTRFLAMLLNAKLPDFTIGTLAAWLEVETEDAHRAVADAEATIAVFRAMIPRLRQVGVHTLGEALAACKRLEQAGQELARAGWAETPRLGPPSREGGERTDTYPYRHRIAELMSAPPLFADPATPLMEALKLMAERRISALFVGDPEGTAAQAAIVTERDVLRAIAQRGVSALADPVADFASRPLATIPTGAYAYRAIGRMARLNIRHLAAIDEATGRIAGALSQRDLLRLRAGAAVVLGDDVDQAADAAAMGRAWAKLPAMAAALAEEGVPARDVAGIVARELGALTRRAAILAEEKMAADGAGAPPSPYSVLVLGSAGRGESLLAMDQDNAVVFAEGAPDGPEDRWFAAFGKIMCALLHEAGVPLCKGGVMASEPAFRGSVETWRERMTTWLGRSSPVDLLNVDIVFDARVVHGDPALALVPMEEFRAAAMASPAFLKLMTASHPDASAPIGFFGGLKGDGDGRIDLKKHVVSRTVAAARVLALRHGVLAGATADRLAGVEAKGVGSAADLSGMRDGMSHAQTLLLRAQLADIAEGRKPDNRAPLAAMSPAEQARLKADIQRLGNLDDIVREALY
jgi:DNA polymerase-3 subunit epsilon/CBS domain-containing protein